MPHGEVLRMQAQRYPVEFYRAELDIALKGFAERRRHPVAQPRLELAYAGHDPDAGDNDDGNQDADDDPRALPHFCLSRHGTIEIFPSRSSVAWRTSLMSPNPCESRAASLRSSSSKPLAWSASSWTLPSLMSSTARPSNNRSKVGKVFFK